jgi:hypothetical protein
MENLSPYEKAKDLVRRYYQIVPNFDTAKDCAGLAVYELIEDRINKGLETEDLQQLRIEIYALGSPHINTEARADRFNEELN